MSELSFPITAKRPHPVMTRQRGTPALLLPWHRGPPSRYRGGMPSHHHLSLFARTNARNTSQTFGFKQADRLFHAHILGKTGTGKSTLLETLALQDIRAGRGCAVIDPHGDLVDRLSRAIPPSRQSDVIYLDAPRDGQPFGYNPLRRVRYDKIPLAASGLMEAWKKLWTDAWGVRMEHVLRNALYALLETEGSTLPDILHLLGDPAFRRKVVFPLKNKQVRAFWLCEFPKYNPRFRQETIAPIQNKVGAFLADPRLFSILVQPKVDLRFRSIMDEGKVLLVNLSKGELGEDSATLLGALLVTTLSLAAFSRAEMPLPSREPFFLYVDEFQSYTTLSVANMISELRKFGVGMVLANQHLHQLAPDIRSAVLGNVGTLVAFRVGAEDALLLSRELDPFTPFDLMNLPNHECYLRLMIDGVPSRPFSATSLRPDELPLDA